MKQRNIPWVGAFVESLFNSLPFLSILISVFNFLSIIVVLYASIKPYLEIYIPHIKLETFIGAVILALLIVVAIVMVVIYKYVTPSLWTFRNKQMNKYDSEVLKKLEEIKKEIAELKNTSGAAK